ncbi:hypothetical protein BJ878DRAFT_509403 [Calycina marina]|uniref:P-loop containing nucleoside triphosphate hydrolase protein n=1 Tax=Calycina marina TaxID=1763456 RepID=A0A9P7Z1J7_9HELO|nr:hypothetical protein BJ878DRAFT_509403 [Calycina marina]
MYGFQLLHAVYVVERFLEDLIKRHCNFHIAFFEENAELCIPRGLRDTHRPRYLLARTVIKRHLKIHLNSAQPGVKVNTFPSLESSAFRKYLDLTPIHFVMAHDGAAKMGQESSDETSEDDNTSKIILRGMIWWFNNHKQNVVLINSIEFRDSKVFTMIVEGFTLRNKLFLSMARNFEKEMATCRENLEKSVNVDEDFPLPNDMATWAGKLLDVTDEENVSESSYVSLMAIIVMLKDIDTDEHDTSLMSVLLLHNIATRFLPLSQRRFPLIRFDDDSEQLIERVQTHFSFVAQRIMENKAWNSELEEAEVKCDIVDLVDGRLLRVIIQAIGHEAFVEGLPIAVQKEWVSHRNIIRSLTKKDLTMTGSWEPGITSISESSIVSETVPHSLAVLPFSSDIFDKHLECIHLDTDTSVASRLGALKLYRETTHWHNIGKKLNTKLLSSEPAPVYTKWRNPLRMNQFYMREMTAYAASLTGSKGRALDTETITVGPKALVKLVVEKKSKSKKEEVQENKPTAANAKKGTKKAAAGLSRKDKMIADNKAQKGSAESVKVFFAWATIRKSFDLNTDDQDRYLKTMVYLNSLDATKLAYLDGEINTYILHSLLNWWATYCKADKKSEGYHVVALIWTTIRSICTTKSPLNKDMIEHATKVCNLLGITDALSSLTSAGPDSKLSFPFNYPIQTQNLQIGISQTEFQLDHCGPYMDRNLDAKPDPRVSSFVPDGWQREVLDQLDANKSVFVVAPTSAGKTFISFYAMEQVLRADNDGVLVYVAPTKALVNQIAAEVQGRFSKKYSQAGKGVWAIHTRDYRVNNSTGCQILVTVPHILQIMLMSPPNARSWATRVRRIIFDEIHSIGQAEDGIVWEQLLLLAPCPIVALSATVGNPEQFSEWLTETQKASGSDLKMIQHGTRYSDLRKYIYEPPKAFEFSGFGKSYGVGLGLDGLSGFHAYHPVASLVDKTRGLPDDLALEPRDCLSLWKAMIKFQRADYKVPESLNPSKALPSCIRKVDIFAWEKNLKKVLLKWMNDRDSPFDKVIQELSPPEDLVAQESSPSVPTASVGSTGGNIDPLDLEATTLPLLYQLHKRRALPAILFNYDRKACEEIAFTMLAQLVDAENKWKKGPLWNKMMAGYEKYQEVKDKKSRKPAKSSKASKDDDDEGGSKTDRMREESSDGVSIYESFDPQAPLADFSFANPKQLPKAELDEHIRELRRKWISEELLGLLGRGIGVNHAGMNRKYRQCIEMLFRKGFLRVVIATGTLSLGINMPCATVVFSGDSVFLTALNFRQAAGRSGRRGYDLLGNVVFQGISQTRASRLLSSRLPELTGHFPITTTLVLRLFSLLNDSKKAPYAVKAINSLLSQPRLYLGGQSFKEQVLHHLRFSIEYLRRNELLGPRGEPVNFTSVVSHLYYTENSSFAFHALLRAGYFHNLCANIDTNSDEVLQSLMLVLSHLFGRRASRKVDGEEEAEKIKNSPSMVYLDPLPKEADDILRKHNEQTLEVFTTYVKTFAAQHVKNDDRYLPLTKTPVGAATPNKPKAVNGSAVPGAQTQKVDLLPSLPTPQARSPFVALSGLGDKFSTIEDLCSSTREGVFLEAAVIPHLEIHPDETRGPLNSYLLDFFKHGSVRPLEEANGIRKSDVWFVLNDFSLVLATISTSLAQYIGLGDDRDPEMLEVMGSGDAIENDGDEKAAEVVMPESGSNKFEAPKPPPIIRKKKVADDWDVGEDEIAEEEAYHKAEREAGTGGTDAEEFEQLMNVYKAFKKLKSEFDEKFKTIWA